MKRKSVRHALTVATVLTLTVAGCSGGGGGGVSRFLGGKSTIPLDTFTAEQIYERGEFELERKRDDDAAFYFGEVERLYPYSEWAKRGLIMQAFAYHKDKDYENSRASAQRFIDVYPTDDDADRRFGPRSRPYLPGLAGPAHRD
jgi:outer membrane protein assembly factor BamD